MASANSGAGPSTGTPGATAVMGSEATGDGGAPHSASHWLNCAAGRGVHDAAEADPGVPGGAHRAVLAGGVDGRFSPRGRRQVGHRPLRDRELGMPGGVAVLDSVVILEQRSAVRRDQNRAERFVARLQGRAGEFDAAA